MYLNDLFIFKMGFSRPLLFYFGLFNTVNRKQCSIEILPMSGLERRTSDVGSDLSANWATTTTTALSLSFSLFLSLCVYISISLLWPVFNDPIRVSFQFVEMIIGAKICRSQFRFVGTIQHLQVEPTPDPAGGNIQRNRFPVEPLLELTLTPHR